MKCKKHKTLFMGMVVLLIAMLVLAPAPIVKAQATTTLTVTATLQGAARPAAGYNVPLTLKLYDQAVTVATANIRILVPLATFTIADGNISITDINTTTHAITFTVSGVPLGTYNITLYTPHCLVNLKNGVMILDTGTMFNMGTLREGDAKDITEGSLVIDIQDFSILAAAFLSVPTSPNWDARADFDRNDWVNIVDFSLLAFNYAKTSPQVVVE